METQTHTLATPDVDLVYNVAGPLPTADGQPPLLMAGHPMTAEGFGTLASHFPDRTVITYDPRGLGRSGRKDGRTELSPELHSADLHALITEIGAPVDIFASSGGAVNALALVAEHPEDVRLLVAHEPPLLALLPDADAAFAAERAVQDAYQQRGSNAWMAQFIALTAWRGEFTDEYAAQPPADPAMFGMPSDDDGSRDDPLLSGNGNGITSFRPDVEALTAAPTRIVIGVGEESRDSLTGRTSVATAEALGQKAVEFPSHHGGFLGGEHGYAGQPEAFAAQLHEVLDSVGR